LEFEQGRKVGMEHGVEWKYREATSLASSTPFLKEEEEGKTRCRLVEAIIYYFVGGTPREECEKKQGYSEYGNGRDRRKETETRLNYETCAHC